jgi:mono/diheme cytochrome c family protein
MSKNYKGKDGRNEPWQPVDPSAASDGDIHRVHDELVDKKESPPEGFSPVPIFLVLLISALIVFSGIYMVWRSDDFDQMGYDESRRRFAWADVEGPVAVDPVLQAGRRIYAQCAACHQPDGQGMAGVFPPLDSTRWVVGNPDRLIRIVMHGLVGPIEVKGNTYNGVMPAFPGLDDGEIAAVLTFIRQSWNNDAPPIAPQDVARVRAEVGPRPSPWQSTELLEQFPLEDPAELEQAVEEPEELEEDAAAAEEPA